MRWPGYVLLAQGVRACASCPWIAAAGGQLQLRNAPVLPQDMVTALLARTTAQLQAVELELAEEQVKLEYTEDEILEMERKEELAEAVSKR